MERGELAKKANLLPHEVNYLIRANAGVFEHVRIEKKGKQIFYSLDIASQLIEDEKAVDFSVKKDQKFLRKIRDRYFS